VSGPTFSVPWLPDGRTVLLPGRGEVFARVHQHDDPDRPTLLLLHGWTASADLQFFTAYRELCEHYSLVAIDHRGHGRGLRTSQTFELEDAADDAAALVRRLGIDQVISIGYSMGGPISMHLARRHPGLVSGMVVQATALEWRATWVERVRWKTVRLLGPVLRSWAYPRWLRYGIVRMLGAGHELEQYIPWLEAEVRRSDTLALVQAGRALSRHDARPWARSLGIPAASLITTNDRLVRPRKQRELAEALEAYVLEMEADHVAVWEAPATYSSTTLALVDHLTGRVRSGHHTPDVAV
jgi:pimeloyl-ACP methyl ester carboxylesterase